MNNLYYDYPDRKYWNPEMWTNSISPIFSLVKWIGANSPIDSTPYHSPINGLYGADAKTLDCYDLKTNSVSIPDVIQYWKNRGVYYECRSQGGLYWLIMCPYKCLEDFGSKIPALVVFHTTDVMDPYWSMKTLECYKTYNDMIAKQQDMMIFYICSDKPDTDRIYVNILQEAFVFVPGDVSHVYMDISAVYNAGMKLSAIPEFSYQDDNGNETDPDACITKFGSAQIPVLDITARWENKTSLTRDQVSMETWSNMNYDFERVLHSETGRKMAEGIALEYRFNKATDPEFIQYWDNMGIKYENHEIAYHRWKSAIPKCICDDPDEKLPVICIMQEVNHANEHLAVTEASYFYEYFRLCAQGACMLINFVLEDLESNELLVDIIKEAKELYPMMDMTRVYIAGHSHNGHYSLAFALRHPDLITAVATYGNPPGLANMGITPMTEERAAEVAKFDIPVINLVGMCEQGSYFPQNCDGRGYRSEKFAYRMSTFEERYAGWQLRLKAFNCPPTTKEKMLATKYSDEKAIRELGLPGDRSQVLYMDGFELYVVEVKNYEGNYHLCMVGMENMPHNTTPAQQVLSWNFLRKFARDRETGKIIEIL